MCDSVSFLASKLINETEVKKFVKSKGLHVPWAKILVSRVYRVVELLVWSCDVMRCRDCSSSSEERKAAVTLISSRSCSNEPIQGEPHRLSAVLRATRPIHTTLERLSFSSLYSILYSLYWTITQAHPLPSQAITRYAGSSVSQPFCQAFKSFAKGKPFEASEFY